MPLIGEVGAAHPRSAAQPPPVQPQSPVGRTLGEQTLSSHHPQDLLTSNEDHLLGLAGAHGIGDGADEGGVE